MAKIYGQLEKAQLENTTSDATNDPKGMMKYRTDQNVAKVSDGSTYKEVVDTTTAQTVENKAHTFFDLIETATPANPSAGRRRIYNKVTGDLYSLNSSGVETLLNGGGGGGGGGASGIETLQNKLESEGFGIKTRELDNSASVSAFDIPFHTFFTGYLIENYTSGGSSINVVWNPIVLNDSDKQYDSTTGYSVTGAGASLSATAGSNKVGSNKYTFDKNGTAVEAGVRYDRTTQTLSVGANYRVWFWINLPSITNLTNVGLRMYAGSTANFRTWTKTTDYAGNALAIGWNLMFIDISDTTGSTTGGTGWTYTELSRYQEIFVTASSAAQTYTGILLDGIWFSHGNIAEVNFNSLEMSGFDNSNKHNFILDTTNTRYDGPLTLDATVAQNYTAGISNANATLFRRSTLSWSTGGSIGFDTTLSSGAIALEQELRIVKQLKASTSADLAAFVDMYTPQVYKVTTVGGSTIGVEDPANTIANLKNGDSIHIFERIINAGEITFSHRDTRAMTADATHLSGTSTLTVSPTSIQVGDFIVKQHLTARASLTAKTADESFTTLSYDTSPNGVQLINQGRAVPNPNNLWGMFDLGGITDFYGLRDRSGNNRTLAKIGSLSLNSDFQRGRYAATNFTTSNYLQFTGATSDLSGVSDLMQISIWYYHVTGSTNTIFSNYSFHGGADERGILLNILSNQIQLRSYNGGGPTILTNPTVLSTGTWNHIFAQFRSTTTFSLYVNGSISTLSPPTFTTSSNNPFLGFRSEAPSGPSNIYSLLSTNKLADCIIWKGGTVLTQNQVTALYNAGAPVPTGFFPVVRNEYALTGQSGQKLSMSAKLTRTTNAVSPIIYDAGVIKT